MFISENTGWYLRWMHNCYENLATLYSSQGQEKEVEIVQVKLSHWLKANPKINDNIDRSIFDETPPLFESFVKKADIWTSALHKIIATADQNQDEEAVKSSEEEELAELK